MNLGELLSQTSMRLKSDWPQLDAQLILAHVLDRPRTWILAHPETPLSAPQLASVEEAVSRLDAGEPLPYILGHWEFFGLDLNVTPDVLIPRPETELLVEKAIAWLQGSLERRTIADVGTGSGAIAISLALQFPDARILATDISAAALEVAKRNAKKFDVHHQIDFVECDLLPEKSEIGNRKSEIDLLCANLPYIPTKTLHSLPIYGREPSLALDGGEDGLDIYRRLFNIAPPWLAPRGQILLEIEATQGLQALSMAFDKFEESEIHLHQDMVGHDRLLEIQLP
jgi:release factor glutamine methyltransferase